MKTVAIFFFILILSSVEADDFGMGCDPDLETGIPCSPCLDKECKRHPPYLRPGSKTFSTMAKQAYPRP
ncbi:hypothetical protein PFISCL1PPCAC_24787 [Pristionchus fissidentatus]|uniref:Uncharacterized protein n=1 Tax=Pristionchus fissidentatus TaxID=1538716 RepID=A0AAV5WS95_9BILA|nr:hypothetical protein PFISCL1PPCAC_24787 [Pristionchus fissidentatus]